MKKIHRRDDSGRVHLYVDVALHDVPESPSQPQQGHPHSYPDDPGPSPPPRGFTDEPF
jgi:putative DNA primase/helicase